MDTVNVMGILLPIYIKDNTIVVKLLKGKEYIIRQHSDISYLEYTLDCIKTIGLTIREQAEIVNVDCMIKE